jgi:hypothetical protein
LAQFGFHLVQLHNFLTSNTLTFAKWQHLKHGQFHPFQGQQLSYIVYEILKHVLLMILGQESIKE